MNLEEWTCAVKIAGSKEEQISYFKDNKGAVSYYSKKVIWCVSD